MSIPKSISLFLASVLVAIPTALTGIHLAKPKPLVHMNDELIELKEREEIQEPEEIRPQSAPKPKQEVDVSSSASAPILPSSGSQSQDVGQQQDEEITEVSVSDEEEGQKPPEPEQPQPPEPDAEEPQDEEEEKEDTKNEEQGDQDDKNKEEPKEQELREFLIQLIPLLIESSNRYKSGDPSLFDTYSVLSKLADLNSTLESYKKLQAASKPEEKK